MAGETNSGAEGGQTVLGTLGGLAAAGIAAYGNHEQRRADAESEVRILNAAKSISSANATASNNTTRNVAIAGGIAALLLALFLITKRKHK